MAHRRELGQRGLRTQHGWAPRTSRRPGRQRLNGDNLLAELEQCGVDTKYSFRADAGQRHYLSSENTGIYATADH